MDPYIEYKVLTFLGLRRLSYKLYKNLLKIKNKNLQRFLHLIYQKQYFEVQEELAEVLNEKDPKALTDFLKANFTLIFDTKKHGDESETFHKYCDNKGSTIVIIYLRNGNIIGGFTTQSWHGHDNYKKDEESFLFSVGGSRVFPIINDFNNAIYCCINCGPAFGYWHELIIRDSCTSNRFSQLNSGWGYMDNDNSLRNCFSEYDELLLDIASYEVYEINK